MITEISKHKIAYTILILGLTILTLLFFVAWPDHVIQRYIAGIIALFYFFWGVITHFKSKYISRRVIFEYASISLLAGLILCLVTM